MDDLHGLMTMMTDDGPSEVDMTTAMIGVSNGTASCPA